MPGVVGNSLMLQYKKIRRYVSFFCVFMLTFYKEAPKVLTNPDYRYLMFRIRE